MDRRTNGNRPIPSGPHKTDTLERTALWKTRHCSSPQLAWSPDDRWLVRADGTATVRLFNVAAAQEASALAIKGHRGTAFKFAPDGLTFLVGTFKGAVVIWDMVE